MIINMIGTHQTDNEDSLSYVEYHAVNLIHTGWGYFGLFNVMMKSFISYHIMDTWTVTITLYRHSTLVFNY